VRGMTEIIGELQIREGCIIRHLRVVPFDKPT
jgi:hypothetical protein